MNNTNCKVNIFLDDLRETPNGFIRTYTVPETIEEIQNNLGNIGILSLDNDLGENLDEGYKVVDWLEEQYYTNKNFILPDKIQIHSANMSAKMRMNKIIKKLYEKN